VFCLLFHNRFHKILATWRCKRRRCNYKSWKLSFEINFYFYWDFNDVSSYILLDIHLRLQMNLNSFFLLFNFILFIAAFRYRSFEVKMYTYLCYINLKRFYCFFQIFPSFNAHYILKFYLVLFRKCLFLFKNSLVMLILRLNFTLRQCLKSLFLILNVCWFDNVKDSGAIRNYHLTQQFLTVLYLYRTMSLLPNHIFKSLSCY